MEEAPSDSSKDQISKTGFKLRRVFVFIIVSVLYAIVMFQRTCTSIVSTEMAKSYNVDTSDLGIFSSIYFYPYGVIQPFIGLLVDIFEPSYMIGFMQIIAAIGAIICGASKTLSVGCFGRFLVGLGCGTTYVATCKIILVWYSFHMQPIMNGILLAIGALGGIIAQGPLAILTEKIDWRYSFYGIGVIGLIFSILCLIFVRGSPTTLGYPPVNQDLAKGTRETYKFKEIIAKLWSNLIQVISNPFFWIVAVYAMFANGPYFTLTGVWISPYLQDIHGYSKQKSGFAAIALSAGLILGSLLIPPLATFVNSKKWPCFVSSILVFIISLIFFLIDPSKFNDISIYICLISIGAFTYALISVAYPMVSSYYQPSLSGTAVGCANFFTFMSSALFQTVSSIIVKKYGKQPGENKFTKDGYKYGIWLLSIISFIIAIISVGIARDVKNEKENEKSSEEGKNEDSGLDLDEI
ncbi:major facilitator superfamily transporter [Histomonas meleagridis]|uniref:major facilitator superfamily transporter n=1 Tax=Histomonas meleagridis TaxID=135588 RepID=UPI00355A31F4|nr:major facilitator superfamily transporter [Histomonas meleagridis]KAH0805922.1 major facilitator superfamily transporter [Histomonas meleagridis]